MAFTCVFNRSLSELLWNHRLAVLPDDPDDKHRIKVRRRAVWADTLHQLRKGLPVTKHLRVTFLGEPAVDAGDPLREFLHLLVASVAHNSLFVGEETSRAPAHNVSAVEQNTYHYVGVILAMSIVHGGPAPCFFTNAVADFILYGLDITRPTIEDVPDQEVRVKLRKVCSVQFTGYVSHTYIHTYIHTYAESPCNTISCLISHSAINLGIRKPVAIDCVIDVI